MIKVLTFLPRHRLSIRLFVKTLRILQTSGDRIVKLPVQSLLDGVVEYERAGKLISPCLLLTSHFVTSWLFEDLPTQSKFDAEPKKNCHSLACDGKFLYITDTSGKGLLKVGTGKDGTIR